MTKILKAAKEYLSHKFSVIPVAKSKKPVISWERYQKELPSEKDIETWWQNGGQNNIAIVTGIISNLAVIDIDDIEMAKPVLDTLIPEFLDIPTVQTPSGGQHLYFRCPDSKIGNNAKIIPGSDFRANGGYVIVPPSENYIWINPIQDDIPNLPQAYINYVKTHSPKKQQTSKPNNKELCMSYFEHGRRDDDLFTVANTLVKAGHDHEFITVALRRIVLSWGEKDESWIQAKVESAFKRTESRTDEITNEIESYIYSTTGNFSTGDIDRELGIITPEMKSHRRVVLHRLKKKDVIETIGTKAGVYRFINKDENIIEWEKADTKNAIDLILPFNIHKYAYIFPKNIIIIAGEKDAGKTAFLLNTIEQNMSRHKVIYFSSEMGDMELNSRIACFEKDFDDWNFTAIERNNNYHDVIRPNDINIIDFLEISDNFFLIAEEIRKIYDRLKKGIAIIAIQKKKGADYGRGAEFSMEKSRLYITLESGNIDNPSKLKVISAKNWKNKKENPRRIEVEYKLSQGCRFKTINPQDYMKYGM